MSDARFSRGWVLRRRAFMVRAADIPGLLAILALAAVILVGSVMAIGACLIPG
jgi:hypothetical protein